MRKPITTSPKGPKITTIFIQYLIRNSLQKIFKMPSKEAWVERSENQLRERGEAQVPGVALQNCLIKVSECFASVNINNRSKSLHDIIITLYYLSH
jgi:hypothetical protein